MDLGAIALPLPQTDPISRDGHKLVPFDLHAIDYGQLHSWKDTREGDHISLVAT
jgi:hypothetical protein